MKKIKLVIVGAKGRMGARIGELASQDSLFEVVARLDIGSQLADMRKGSVVIDFSQAKASLVYLQEAAKLKLGYVLGTTGISEAEEKIIRASAKKIPVVKSSNMSMGVNIFFKVAQEIAKALPGYTIQVKETHHVHKKDAPSGTALQVGRLMEAVSKQKVTYESIREGEVVGDHQVSFTGGSDRLELFHHADSRDIFAAGALQAAKWVFGKKPGLYSMSDVLSLK